MDTDAMSVGTYICTSKHRNIESLQVRDLRVGNALLNPSLLASSPVSSTRKLLALFKTGRALFIWLTSPHEGARRSVQDSQRVLMIYLADSKSSLIRPNLSSTYSGMYVNPREDESAPFAYPRIHRS